MVGRTIPEHPFTLAVDIGGTGLKASVLDANGAMVADRVKIPTPYPLPPDKLVATLVKLVAAAARRPSAGVGGLPRHGARRAWSCRRPTSATSAGRVATSTTIWSSSGTASTWPPR